MERLQAFIGLREALFMFLNIDFTALKQMEMIRKNLTGEIFVMGRSNTIHHSHGIHITCTEITTTQWVTTVLLSSYIYMWVSC